MKTLVKHGSYEVVQYDENLITIDFNNKNIGVTVKAFSNKDTALNVFNAIVTPLTVREAKLYKDDVRKAIIYSN